MPQNEKNAKPIGGPGGRGGSWSKTECQKSGKAFYAPAFLYYEKLCRTLRHCCDLYFYHGSRKCAGNLVYADLNRRLYPAADEAERSGLFRSRTRHFTRCRLLRHRRYRSLHIHKNYGQCLTGYFKASARRHVHPHGRASHPVF